MSTTPKPDRSRAGLFALEVFLRAGALAGLAFACWSFGTQAREAPALAVGRGLLAQEIYSDAALKSLLDGSDEGACRWRADRARTLAAGARAQSALLGGADASAGEAIDALSRRARRLLACAPYDGFGWFALYWAELNAGAPEARTMGLLAMSYETAPIEPWLAVMRNPLAMGALDAADSATQEAIAREWTALARGGFSGVAAQSLARIAPERRTALFERASDDARAADLLAQALERLGVEDSLSRPEPPWRPFRRGSPRLPRRTGGARRRGRREATRDRDV